MGLATLEDVYTYLGQSYNPSDLDITDEQYQFFIDTASAEIERYCNRHFEAASYTEYQDGHRTNVILTDNYPIISVSEVVTVDNKQDVDTTLDMDYIIIDYPNGEVKYSGNFPEGYKNIRIRYRAGYEQIPYDLVVAVCKMVVNEVRNTSTNTNMKSEKLGDYSYTLKTGIEISDDVKTLLNQFKKFD